MTEAEAREFQAMRKRVEELEAEVASLKNATPVAADSSRPASLGAVQYAEFDGRMAIGGVTFVES